MRKYVIFLILSLQAATGLAQTEGHVFHLGSGVSTGSGKNMPFWLLSNRYGLLANDFNQAFLRAGASKALKEDGNFSIGYGLTAVGRLYDESDLYIEEWYGNLRFHFLELEAGARQRRFGVQNDDTGSGGLIWSGNARPMPAIIFKTSGFVEVPFTSGFMEIDGGIGHYRMPDVPGIEDVMLHHKWFLLKAGGTLPLQLTAGLHHFAEWGGVSQRYGELPVNLRTFWKVFIANGGNEDSPENEQINAAGNHLGSYNLRLDAAMNDIKVGVYWESVFEDNSGRRLRNFPDGLYGIAFTSERKDPLIKEFTVEYVRTDYQSGKIRIDSTDFRPPTGQDSYFEHYIYNMGWSAYNRTIGTPLISSPLYGPDGETFINNRIGALHAGLKGGIRNFDYRILYTHTLNKGTYRSALDPASDDDLLLLSLGMEDLFVKNSMTRIDIGIDIGAFYGNNRGILLVWERKFDISKGSGGQKLTL